MVGVLLEVGADISAEDRNGQTGLEIIAEKRRNITGNNPYEKKEAENFDLSAVEFVMAGERRWEVVQGSTERLPLL